jgi:DNA-binding beta-propeller fold protein YncE/mono/diheme cytochrome c family protein
MGNVLRIWIALTVTATACIGKSASAESKGVDAVADSAAGDDIVSRLLAEQAAGKYLSPTALVASPEGKALFIACATANQVIEFDVAARSLGRRFNMPSSPSGLVLSADGTRLYITCADPASLVCVLDVPSGRVAKIQAGHTAMAPVLTPDEKWLLVCNRFNNAVSVIDLTVGKEACRIPVPREPVAAALTEDGKHLLVANHIHNGRADLAVVSAVVTVIDVAARKVVKNISLPNGSTLLRDVQVSSKYACVTHLLARFHLPTTQIERGWIQSNALTLIDLTTMEPINTVLLDNIDQGAANPWAAAWSRNGQRIFVTHAGTHELSIIDAAGLLAKLSKVAPRTAAEVPNDLSFLVGLRIRVKLHGKGPRALAILDDRAYVANYFSDSIEIVTVAGDSSTATHVPFAASGRLPCKTRLGEMHFNDATLCFQGWLSCASCHSSDARVDGMNWDLLNDGIGNPKNAKNLLLAHQTPPTTALGVRENAHVSVRAGIKHILFTVQPEVVADALDEYLQSLKPIPSPYLVNGKLSESALRGKKLFQEQRVGCADCHKPGLFTSLKRHDVGTHGDLDNGSEKFDTPTLIEAWRSAPYLHDGSAATIRDVITTRNREDRHGVTSHLTPEQLNELTAYVLSL